MLEARAGADDRQQLLAVLGRAAREGDRWWQRYRDWCCNRQTRVHAIALIQNRRFPVSAMERALLIKPVGQ
jgi:hypothetical protein